MLLDAWITTLHIAFFAIGLSMSEGMSLYMQSLLRAGVPDTKLLAARAKYFDRIGAVAWLLCAGTGLFLTCRSGFDWTVKWISVSVGLFAVLALNGIFGHGRWLNRVMISNGDPGLLQRASRLKTVANLISFLVVSTILALMVIKPA